jgi:hypothetical protein
MTRQISPVRCTATNLRRGFGVLWLMLAVAPAFAGPMGMETPDRWKPHATVGVLERVTLNVHWYEDLDALHAAAVAHNVGAIDLRGFSILRGNAKTGEYVCDVHVVRMRGALVDNDRTVTFGHEVLHCFGFRHEQ